MNESISLRLGKSLLDMYSGNIPGATEQEKAGLQYGALWLAKEFKDVLTSDLQDKEPETGKDEQS